MITTAEEKEQTVSSHDQVKAILIADKAIDVLGTL